MTTMRSAFAAAIGLSVAVSCVGAFEVRDRLVPDAAMTVASSSTAQSALVAALRAHVKHVFVIYQENHSFDEYFGTYPGADNLAGAGATTHGFRQYDPIGKRWVTPFRITDPDIDDPSHSRDSLFAKMDGGSNDQYVSRQETDGAAKGYDAVDQERLGLLTMAYYDCDTIPILWKYAHSFALYDRFFEGMTGPSTPGNIEIVAAQTGLTQVARTPSDAVAPNGKGPGDPIYADPEPAFGPYSEKPEGRLQIDQRYATVLLTLNGSADSRATVDTSGVREDLASTANSGRSPVTWGWYQEGFVDRGGTAEKGYESHHNPVQYFGYMRQNGVFWNNVHEAHDLFAALRDGGLPDRSVVYVKGGTYNHFGWRPANRDAFVQQHFLGDDDHPGTGDSDRQLSETFVATYVDAIARSRYWKDSAIVITWDDSGGFYDHAVPPVFERCPDGRRCGDGPRVPLILISPYAKAGAVVHDAGDTASVVRFVEMLYGLPVLAWLPDEKPYMPQGPRDAEPRLTDLSGAFDPQRLSGARPPLPASAAIVPDAILATFPTPMNCASIGVRPVELRGGLASPPPGFGPRVLHPQP